MESAHGFSSIAGFMGLPFDQNLNDVSQIAWSRQFCQDLRVSMLSGSVGDEVHLSRNSRLPPQVCSSSWQIMDVSLFG